MEDNDCVMKYIEIVPLDNFNNCSDVTDIKQEPVSVKVSTACQTCPLKIFPKGGVARVM